MFTITFYKSIDGKCSTLNHLTNLTKRECIGLFDAHGKPKHITRLRTTKQYIVVT